ncbi:hypothetical protein CEXT_491871 [Caerostris extrusa]|uniref:Uncharacterized protein n=1 Tax=Caerostris extrusa TaxID=172846 RepID=A0AAV4URK8_CAEEX|nr:hypothetical protein CEXT_491871 [Caerostris extrusa]
MRGVHLFESAKLWTSGHYGQPDIYFSAIVGARKSNGIGPDVARHTQSGELLSVFVTHAKIDPERTDTNPSKNSFWLEGTCPFVDVCRIGVCIRLIRSFSSVSDFGPRVLTARGKSIRQIPP